MSDLSNPVIGAPDQAKAYVAALMQELGSRNPLAVLRETPMLLARAIAGLSPEQEAQRERPGKWSIRHVAQHLADSELVAAFRIRMVLAHESPALPSYDQDAWAERLRYEEADAAMSAGDFRAYREGNLRLYERATPQELKRVMRHPERGDESLDLIMRMYAGHDLVHLKQIARIRAATGAPPAAA
jgi:DinB family protein